MAVHLAGNDKPSYEFYYTPLTTRLREMAGKLGGYLHAPGEIQRMEDGWWHEARTFLEDVHDELRIANTGTMLGVPLREPKTGGVRFFTDAVEQGASDVMKRLGRPHARVVLHVSHSDDL